MTYGSALMEGGSEGTALSNANSGSPTSSIGSGSSTAFRAAAAATGSFGARFTCGTNAFSYRRWNFAVASSTFTYSDVVEMPASAPSATLGLFSFPNSGGAFRLRVQVTTGGIVQLTDIGGAHTISLNTGSPVTWGDKYRIAVQATGGSTTASVVAAQMYSGSFGVGWTTSFGSGGSASNFNMGTDTAVGIDIGIVTNAQNSTTVGHDDVQWDNASTTPLGDLTVPPADVAAPVATMSLQAYAPTISASSSATVNAPAATMSMQVVVGSASFGVAIGVPCATVSLQAVAPAVSTASSVTVTAPAATMSLQAREPVVSFGVAVAAVKASATMTAYAPGISAGGSVSIAAPAATLAFTPRTPVVGVGVTVAAVKAGGSFTALVPSIGTGATVAAVRSTLTLQARTPVVSVGGSVSIVAPPALMSARAFAPSISANPIRIITAFAEIGQRTKTGVLTGRRWGGTL